MVKSFTSNVITTYTSQILAFILGIGTSVIVARALGPEGKGAYTIVSFLVSFLVYYSTFGLGQSSVFYIGRKTYPERVVLGHNLFYAFMSSTLAIICGLVIVYWFGESLFPGVSKWLLLFGMLLIPTQLLFGFLAPILLGLQEILYYNITQLFRASALLMAVIVLLLWLGLGVRAAILAELVAFLVAAVIAFVLVYRCVGGVSMKLNPKYLKDSFRFGLTVYSGSTLVFLHYRADIFLINLFLNPAMVGLYAVSAGLSEKLSMVSDTTATVLFPRISSEPDLSKIREFTPLVFRTVMLFIVSTAFVLWFMSPWFITTIYSDAFLGSVRPFQILLLGSIALCGWSILESDLKGRGKPIWGTVATAFSVVINIGLNMLWIPKYGIIGAAYASAFSYGGALLIVLIAYCRFSGNSLNDVLLPRRSDFLLYRKLIIRLMITFLNFGRRSVQACKFYANLGRRNLL